MTWDDLKSFPARLRDAESGVSLTPLGKRFVRLTGAVETIPPAERAAWYGRRGPGFDGPPGSADVGD